MSKEHPKVNFEIIQTICRIYYEGNYENKTPFDAVLTVLFLGEGKAKILAAHGTITLTAYREIARQLQSQFNITHCEVDRHGRTVVWDVARAAKFRA